MKEKKLLALFLILLTVPIGGVGLDMYSPALPAVAASLHLSIALVQWTISIFVFGICVGMLIFGSLSDSWGRKPVMLGSALAFLVTSLVITEIHSGIVFLSLRLIQGIAAGALQAAARGMVTDVFEKPCERRKVTLYMTTTWGLGPVLAPWIGSLLQHEWGWIGCFYGFAVYALVLLVCYVALMKETHVNKMSLGAKRLCADFAYMLRHKQFVSMMLVMALSIVILMLFGLVGPFYIQDILGYSPVEYGRLALVAGGSYLSGTLICRMMQSVAPMKVMGIGLVFISIANVVCWVLAHTLHEGQVVVYICDVFMSCMGLGLIYPVSFSGSVACFPDMAGRSGALSGAGNMFVGSIVSFVIALWKYSHLAALIELYMLMILGIWVLFWFLLRLEARQVCTQ